MQGLLEAAHISQQLHDGIDPSIVDEVSLVIPDEDSDHGEARRVVRVVIEAHIGYQGEASSFTLVTQLKELVLQLRLTFHHIQVGKFLSLALHLKEQGVIDELFDGSVVVSEIKVRVNECEAKVFGVEILVNICPILALHLTGAWVALEELDFEEFELI